MKEKFDKIVNSKYFVIILIVVLMGLTLLAGTFAWFTWRSKEDTTITLKIGNVLDVVFESGNDINTPLTPVFYYDSGEKTTINVIKKGSSAEIFNYAIKINIETIPEELRKSYVNYALVKNDALVVTGNFEDASNGSSIEIYRSQVEEGTTAYVLYLYIDANYENASDMMGKKLVGNIMVEEAS